MSHFSVIVVTDEKPTDDVLSQALQPFHEFECTGTNDQYVQEVDETEDCRKEYESHTYTRLRDAAGNLHDPYDDLFYRDPTAEEVAKHGPFIGSGGGGGLSWTSKDWEDGRGYRTKIKFVPDGMEEIEVPAKQVKSFIEFIKDYYGREATTSPDTDGEHKYGYVLVDDAGEVLKIVDRTNPGKKWDYWRVGGRYTGRLIPRVGELIKAPLSWEWDRTEESPPSGGDICQKGDLDERLMKSIAVRKRREWIAKIRAKSGLSADVMDAALADYQAGNKVWLELPEPRPRGNEFREWMRTEGYELGDQFYGGCEWGDVPEIPEGQTIEEWCLAAPFLSCFAFLRDGKWSEEGRMGWWAIVHDENEHWPALCERLIQEVPDDKWLTVVDCHI